MHTYKEHGHGWTVGRVGRQWAWDQDNDGKLVYRERDVWIPMKNFDSEIHAAAFVNYLNGGEGFSSILLKQGRDE